MQPTDLIVYGVLVHLVCDWFLQNDWMARNKANLTHPAAWVHGGIHFVGMLLIFAPFWAISIAILHMLIDTRVPLVWWRRVYHQTTTGDVALHVAIWEDQVAHVVVVAIAALLSGGM